MRVLYQRAGLEAGILSASSCVELAGRRYGDRPEVDGEREELLLTGQGQAAKAIAGQMHRQEPNIKDSPFVDIVFDRYPKIQERPYDMDALGHKWVK